MTPHLQKLTNVTEVSQLHKCMINTSETVHSFTFNKNDDKDPPLIWTILTHPGTYIGTIGMLFAVCIGVYGFKRLWFRPANPRHWPYSPVSSWQTIVDDNIETACIYRSRDTFEEQNTTRIVTCALHKRLQGQRVIVSNLSCQKEFLYLDHLVPKAKIWGIQ